MKLEARITQLDFRPYDYVKIEGYAHSSYDYGKICGTGNSEFNLGWFWRNDMPEEIKSTLIAVERDTIINLQERGAIPKAWPGKLVDKVDDGVFTFKLDKFIIYNADWNVSDNRSYVDVLVQSPWHNNGKEITSTVRLEISKEYNKRLFTILDENL